MCGLQHGEFFNRGYSNQERNNIGGIGVAFVNVVVKLWSITALCCFPGIVVFPVFNVWVQ